MKSTTSQVETEIVSQALRYCKRRVAVDGGANVGIFTEKLLAYFDTVVAYEPVPSTFDLLRKRFGEHTRLLLYQKALWSSRGEIVKMGPSSKVKKSTSYHVQAAGFPVETTTIDSSSVVIDLLKLDLEGAEFQALCGAEQTLRNYRPVVIVELVDKHLSRYKNSTAQLHDWMVDRGYFSPVSLGVNRLYVPIA